MPKRIVIILFLSLIFESSFSQQVLKQLSNYQATQLSNGVTIITVKIPSDSLINYQFVVDFNPKVRNTFPGAIETLARYLDFSTNGYDQIYLNRVSDTNAVDSMLNFVSFKTNVAIYEQYLIDKATKIEINKSELLEKSLYEHKIINRRFCFGTKSPYSVLPTANNYATINEYTLQEVHNEIMHPQNFYIIAVGNVEHDTIVKYARKNFETWSTSPIQASNYNFTKPLISNLFFKDLKEYNYLTISYPTRLFYTDPNFFSKIIIAEIFKEILNKRLPGGVKNNDLQYNPEYTDALFAINLDLSDGIIYESTLQTISTLRDMLLYTPNVTESNEAKKILTEKFKATLRNPYNIAHYAYITYKYGLNSTFFEDYEKSINSVSINQLQESSKDVFFPDNLSIFIQADYDKIVCDLYSLAKFYKVEFYDKDFRKYKIIPFGFDSGFIIYDYLSFCNAFDGVKNLKIKFHADYMADTVYNLQGIIYKKSPYYYYYKTELVIGTDTLLHQLKVANDEVWLDSTSIGSVYYEEENFWAKVYQAYIFPELYYEKLNYTTEMICDTSLIKNNIFKIKVTTPYNVYFYDYYNINTKEKIKTETVIIKNLRPDTVQVVEYFDYRDISKTSTIKMPHQIKQIIDDYEFTMQVDTIIDKEKIKKKTFELYN